MSINTTKPNYIAAIGRRKSAICRVRLVTATKENKSAIIVNNLPVEKYFSSQPTINSYLLPLQLTDTTQSFYITAKINGSGTKSQITALTHAIARALVKVNPDHKASLRKNGLLTRDPRERQRRHIGMGGKSRRRKQSPKR